MKQCKHARFERDHKWLCSETERADGCWKCGGELVPAGLPKHEDQSNVNMDDDLRKQAEGEARLANVTLVDAAYRPAYSVRTGTVGDAREAEIEEQR